MFPFHLQARKVIIYRYYFHIARLRELGVVEHMDYGFHSISLHLAFCLWVHGRPGKVRLTKCISMSYSGIIFKLALDVWNWFDLRRNSGSAHYLLHGGDVCVPF